MSILLRAMYGFKLKGFFTGSREEGEVTDVEESFGIDEIHRAPDGDRAAFRIGEASWQCVVLRSAFVAGYS